MEFKFTPFSVDVNRFSGSFNSEAELKEKLIVALDSYTLWEIMNMRRNLMLDYDTVRFGFGWAHKGVELYHFLSDLEIRVDCPIHFKFKAFKIWTDDFINQYDQESAFNLDLKEVLHEMSLSELMNLRLDEAFAKSSNGAHVFGPHNDRFTGITLLKYLSHPYRFHNS